MLCSLMSFVTSDLEVQEVEVEVVAETMRNEHHWRKVVVAVSKHNLCGRIIQEKPNLFNPFTLQLFLMTFLSRADYNECNCMTSSKC